MPNDAALRMRSQIKATDHDLALLKVFSNGESEEILIDFAIQIELLNKKRGTLASSNGCQANDTITGHPRQALLIGCRDKGHLRYTLIRLS